MNTHTVKYLNPKNDLTFRKIFGQYPDITKSFLNALLPLEEDRYIEYLTFQDPAMLPIIPELKHSVVDVRCTDNYGRQFIVEMQMYWTSSFKNRMLFNAGKAYVKQIDAGEGYGILKPVYGLSLVDDIFMKDDELKKEFYHHYRLSHTENPDKIIEGIELIFIELPKFKPQTITQKKMQALWLRFLTEIDENTKEIPQELLRAEEISKALEHLQISAFTKEELEYYDKYWDKIRVEKTAIDDAKRETAEAKLQVEKERKEKEQAKQREEQAKQREEQAKQREEQAKQREEQAKIKLAKKMLKYGESIEEIMKETGLSKDEIENL